MDKHPDAVIISCGIFKKELSSLVRSGALSIPIRFLDSSLHMHPEELEKALMTAIGETLPEIRRIVLVYGDCHPYIDDRCDPERVVRLPGINCCEIVLGRDEYRRLRKEGVFFVFDEWALRWKEVFIRDIGLDEKNASLFMQSMHKSILFLDTGVGEIPVVKLREMSTFFGLPFSIRNVSLDTLKDSILKALA